MSRIALVTVYEFDELTKKAKDKVIDDIIVSWLEMPDLVPDEAKAVFDQAINRAQGLQTPWFAGSYIYDLCREIILTQCRQFYYFANGDVYHQILEECAV